MGINDWLSRRRQLSPDREAVFDEANGRRFCYAELDERATRVAQKLRDQFGIVPGDRVACLSTNRLEYLDLYFACGKIGAILAPLNHRLPAREISELLDDCTPNLLVFESGFAGVVDAARLNRPRLATWAIDAAGEESSQQCMANGLSKSDSVAGALPAFAASEGDVAMILYTSGTTGRAKGAKITYRQIHWNALNTIIGLGLTDADVAFLNMPLHHTGGWHVLFTPLMLLGGRVILQPRFDAERCNRLVGPERISILFGVPTTLRMMAEATNFAEADFSGVRFAIFGGESCPLPLIQTYAERGVAMRQGYGLTEAGPNCFSLPTADAVRKQGSIGFPNFLVDVRLCGEDGCEVGVGEVGELQIRGPHVFGGYWNNPQATQQAFNKDWLLTGDQMTREEEGYYYVIGRKKEMYISGGENVYPAQVERVLQQHEAVALAAVVGMPDPQWGECGWAFVQLHAEATVNEADLQAWCERRLARFQRPARCLLIDQMPLGPSGKCDKRALAKLATPGGEL
jgi:fatty-acyl-CoA synthase